MRIYVTSARDHRPRRNPAQYDFDVDYLTIAGNNVAIYTIPSGTPGEFWSDVAKRGGNPKFGINVRTARPGRAPAGLARTKQVSVGSHREDDGSGWVATVVLHDFLAANRLKTAP